MTTLELRLDGAAAADVLDDLAIDAEGGMFDQALLNLLRDHLRRMGDFRDWRIVSARVDVQEEIP